MADYSDSLSMDSFDSGDSRPTTRSSTKIGAMSNLENSTHSLRRLGLNSNRFMENFNPETSARERRKLHRKLHTGGGKKNTGVLFDELGNFIATGQDICDCLLANCPGCFFACPKCNSEKCGSECRSNRKYIYEQVDIEGCNISIKNTHGKTT